MKRSIKSLMKVLGKSKRTRSLRHKGRSLSHESLEGRQLLTAVIGNTLLIDAGTPQADQVQVEMDYGSLLTKQDDQVVVQQTLDGVKQTHSFDMYANTGKFWTKAIQRVRWHAGGGNDHFLNSTPIPSRVYGGAGDDQLHGGAGPDLMLGGVGVDMVVGNEGNDSLYGDGWASSNQGHADLISGGPGDDWLVGGPGNDLVFGREGNDRILGGAGDDYLAGQEGNDKLWGQQGDDLLDGGQGFDQLWGGAGNDDLLGGEGSDTLYGQKGDDNLQGGQGTDLLWGGNGKDFLQGGNGRDRLFGQRGNDSLVGDLGDLRLVGGRGQNTLSRKPLAANGGVTLPASGIAYNASTNTVQIYGSVLADKAEVSRTSFSVDINTPPIVMTHVSLGQYVDVGGETTFVITESETFFDGVTPVNQVRFWGYNGDDEFRNHTAIASTASGGAGEDTLAGGSGQDLLYGGADNDTLHAGGGNDSLFGESGDDSLYAGAGNDVLNGGAGDDVLVSIGGGSATLHGGLGRDSFWQDPIDIVADASNWEIANGHIHEVDQFMNYQFTGGNSPVAVSKELNGQNLPDPQPILAEGVSLSLKNFSDHPLFASGGPTKDDIFQGSVGDCYFMAPLSAIADANPDFIRQMVVDLGDGTYAVRYHDNGQEVYVRVDADLWVQNGSPRYADLGQEGALWGPIVEKAYAFFRKQQGTYASVSSGNGTLAQHLGVTTSYWEITDGVTPQEVVDWHNDGSPPGALQDKINTGVLDLLNWVDVQLAAGKAVTTGAYPGISNNTTIKYSTGSDSTYRRGKHIYMVDSVLKDNNGDPIGLVLRDPYGYDRTITDATRLHFCIGRAGTWNVGPSSGNNYVPEFEAIVDEILPVPCDPLGVECLTQPNPGFQQAHDVVFAEL